jgi:hypothetical protein
MVHFPTLSSFAYGFSGGSLGMSQGGFPHSDIPGSKLVCSSPGLIAAYRVLHRLLAPRHSPYALSSLTIRNSELTLTDSGLVSLEPARVSSHAHCVCVVGKTTVCRVFSCQRSASALRASARQAMRPEVTGPAEKPSLRSLGLPSRSSLSPGRLSGQASAERGLENTGLEPVTSWLQTRRSPS